MAARSKASGPHPSRGRAPATLRLIGGEWRGRRIAIGDAPGLRPTPDRIRETLFNWLAPRIAGAHCIDAFAGTGALGLEALSRGAAHVTFIERDRTAAEAIRAALTTLGGADRAQVVQTDALTALTDAGQADIIFIDPPFDADLHAVTITAITPRIAPHTHVYLEYPAGRQAAIEAALEPRYDILRNKHAGSVGYCLARPALGGEDGAQ